MDTKRPSLLLSSWMYALSILFLFYAMAVQVAPSVMTHELMRDFSITAKTLGLMLSAFYYTDTSMQIPVGLCFDHTGPRELLSLASLFCAAGAGIMFFTHLVWLAAIGRALMGFGASFAFVGAMVVSARWFTIQQFPILLGVTQFMATLGAIAGEVPLAYFVQHMGWRGAILLLGISGLVLALLIFACLRDQPKNMGDQYHQIIHKERSLWHHLHAVLSKSQTWYLAFYGFCSWGPIVLFAALWGVPFLVELYTISAGHAAMGSMMMWLGLGIFSPIVGWMSTVWFSRRALLMATALFGLVVSLVVLYVKVSMFVMFVLLFGLGAACSGQILTFALVRNNNTPSVLGTALAFNNMAEVFGGAVLQPIAGFILHSLWTGGFLPSGVHHYTVANFQGALLLIPGLYLMAFVMGAFFIKETKSTIKTKSAPP